MSILSLQVIDVVDGEVASCVRTSGDRVCEAVIDMLSIVFNQELSSYHHHLGLDR